MVAAEIEQQPLLISILDLVALTGIARQTLDRLKSAGRLPRHIVISSTLHKWRRSDVFEWIEMGMPSQAEFEARKAASKKSR